LLPGLSPLTKNLGFGKEGLEIGTCIHQDRRENIIWRASTGFAKTAEGSCENLRHVGSCFGWIGVVNGWIKHHAKRGEVWLGMIERQNEHAVASIALRNCHIALRSCLLRRVMTSGHKSARANPSLDIGRGGAPVGQERFRVSFDSGVKVQCHSESTHLFSDRKSWTL
jgi:hypothetical protein